MAHRKTEWLLTNIGQVAQSGQDYSIESEQKIIDTRNPSFINESKSSDR